jgi:hypothetical protein
MLSATRSIGGSGVKRVVHVAVALALLAVGACRHAQVQPAQPSPTVPPITVAPTVYPCARPTVRGSLEASASTTPAPRVEVCNAFDDDADGTVDEACVASGTLLWLQQLAVPSEGTLGGHYGTSVVAATSDGGMVVAGRVSGVVTLGAADHAITLDATTTSTRYGKDAFVAKFRADGSVAWARQVGGRGEDQATAIAALPDGSVIVVGYSIVGGSRDAKITFGCGEAGEQRLRPADGLAAIFIAKLDPQGDLLWAKLAYGPDQEFVYAVASLPDGGAVIVGSLENQLTLGAGEPGEVTMAASGRSTLFVARYASTGAVVWAQSIGGRYVDPLSAVAVVGDGDILVTGGFRGDVTFGRGESDEVTLHAVDAGDLFVARYTVDGQLVWARSAGGPRDEHGFAVVASTDGGAFVGGQWFYPYPDTTWTPRVPNPGLGHPLTVARYDATGSQQWARTIGGYPGHEARSIGLLPSGELAVLGRFRNDATFARATGVNLALTSAGDSDLFLAKYDVGGEPVAVFRIGSEWGDDVGGLAVLKDGSVVITGEISSGRRGVFGGATDTPLEPGFFLAKIAL